MNESKNGFQAAAKSLSPISGAAQEDRAYSCSIPEGWRQGRTVHGGITAGLMIATAQKQFPGLPPFRSATINFIGPVSQDPVFTSLILRRGRNVTSVQTQAMIEQNCVASAVFLFAQQRPSHVSQPFPAQPTPMPDECAPYVTPEIALALPAFLGRFDIKLIAGGRPLSPDEDGFIRVWARHRDPASRSGIASLLTIGDVLPPAATTLFKKMGPLNSMNWIFTSLKDAPQTQDGWWQIESRLTAAQGGYSTQVMRIWNIEGDLVAEAMQCIVIFV